MIDEDGIPRTINKGVKVNMIEVKYSAGDSAQYIAENYGIEVADIYAALTYFHNNRAYFEERRRQVAPLIDEAKARTEALKAEIQTRLDANKGE